MNRRHTVSGCVNSFQASKHPDVCRRYLRRAFDNWLSTSDAGFTPLLVNHDPDLLLPTRGGAAWEFRRDGLWFETQIDATKPLGRLAAMAVRYGFLSGFSIGARLAATLPVVDDVLVVREADIREVSLTDAPACPGTTVFINGQLTSTQRMLPSDPDQRRQLVAFLERCHIDPQPIAAQRSTQPPLEPHQVAARAALRRLRDDADCRERVRNAGYLTNLTLGRVAPVLIPSV